MKHGKTENSIMIIRIAYLYPNLMNIYGDHGNILCLKKRCQWRGIETKIKEISRENNLNPDDFDLLFAGGGQDRQQKIIAYDLQSKKSALLKATEMNKPMLTICGSYQLFGQYFQPFEAPKLPGIGVFNAYTVASNNRKIGNIIIESKVQFVGFENHSGNTFLKKNSNTKALGKVIKGFGNNGQDKTEGAVYKNVIGTYLHGPVLPKNPHLADWLIQTALEVKYQKKITLNQLNDSLEWQTHHAASKRSRKTHQLW